MTNSSPGVTNQNKYMRIGSTGTLEWVSSNGGSVILSLTDAGYLNMRSLVFSYDIPAKLISRLGMSRARVYISGENLFLINARKGMNVQQNFSGTTSNYYSPNRVVTFGLNVKF